MLKVSLVNMPFAAPHFPSIALTQLKAVAESRCGEQVQTRILYLNHDFAHYLGVEVYQVMNSVQASNAGLGDWSTARSPSPTCRTTPRSTSSATIRSATRSGAAAAHDPRQAGRA